MTSLVTPSKAQTAWDVGVSLAATAMALVMPMGLVFQVEPQGIPRWIAGTVTAVMILDIGVRFYQVYTQPRIGHGGESSLRRFAGLIPDVIAATPLYLLIGVTPLESIRLVKLIRVGQLQRQWRMRDVRSTNSLRLQFFVYWLAISAHWVSCGWVALEGPNPDISIGSQYLNALYWCVATLTTVGYGDVLPTTDAQKLYTTIVMLLGIGVYAFIIGNIATILTNLDPARALYLQRLERIDAFMRYRRLPRRLRHRIRSYYQYLWIHRVGYDESEVLRKLPPHLRTEVAMYLKKDLIENVPLFQGTSNAFVREIALEMHAAVFMPGDWIMRAGARGRQMYFISQGEVEVLAPDGKTVFCTLSEGDYFGEIALFFERPRTASVRALTYCDLYSLDKATFERILEEYPTIAKEVVNLAHQRAAE